MIDFKDVSKVYDEKRALDHVNIHIDDGEFVFLVGPTGAGKSTFVKLISRELDADDGCIEVDGVDISELSNREIPGYRRQFGMIFQEYRLLPNLTVYENVAFANEVTHCSRSKIKDLVPRLLDVVGIGDLAGRFPGEISGGEQQRVGIARAIANNPKYILADEPTGNLDPGTKTDIMSLLMMLNERGTTIIMVTHDLDIVKDYGKRVITVENGKVISDKKGGRFHV